MKPLSVEDGMSDELVCSDKELEDCWDHLAVPVEERTAEMKQLLRRLVDATHDEKDVIALAVYSTRGLASIVQEAKALLLDHIEGKAKAESQEVKE